MTDGRGYYPYGDVPGRTTQTSGGGTYGYGGVDYDYGMYGGGAGHPRAPPYGHYGGYSGSSLFERPIQRRRGPSSVLGAEPTESEAPRRRKGRHSKPVDLSKPPKKRDMSKYQPTVEDVPDETETDRLTETSSVISSGDGGGGGSTTETGSSGKTRRMRRKSMVADGEIEPLLREATPPPREPTPPPPPPPPPVPVPKSETDQGPRRRKEEERKEREAEKERRREEARERKREEERTREAERERQREEERERQREKEQLRERQRRIEEDDIPVEILSPRNRTPYSSVRQGERFQPEPEPEPYDPILKIIERDRRQHAHVLEQQENLDPPSPPIILERERRQHAYVKGKVDPEPEIVLERERHPYASAEPSKSSTMPKEHEVDANTRRPAPYARTYSDRPPPPPKPEAYRPHKDELQVPSSPTTDRKPTPYSYVPKSANSSETPSSPRRTKSRRRTEERDRGSRESTPSGAPRSPGARDNEFEDPLVAKLREAEQKRTPAPYAYTTPTGSVSSGTGQKLKRTPSQGPSSKNNPQSAPQSPNLYGRIGGDYPHSSPTPSYSSVGSGRPAAVVPPYPMNSSHNMPDPRAPYGSYPNSPHIASFFPQQQSVSSIPGSEFGPPCPESTAIPWGTWYHPPYTPKFTICECCYRKHIAPTSFAGHFTKIEASSLPAGENQPVVLRSCMFHSNLVKQLWATMVRNQTDRFYQYQAAGMPYIQDGEAFYAFARARAAQVNCVGPVGVQPPITASGREAPHQAGRWPKWWAAQGALSQFLICEACYADYIDTGSCLPDEARHSLAGASALVSPYWQMFREYTLEMFIRTMDPGTRDGTLPVWICDVGSNMLIKHLLEEASKPVAPVANWTHFVQLTGWFLNEARPCPGQTTNELGAQAVVMSGGRRWYKSKRHPPSAATDGKEFCVCEKCYYDLLVPAGLANEFAEAWVSRTEPQPQCGLAMMEYRFPLSMAKETKNYQILWDAIGWGMSLRRCDDRGYTLGESAKAPIPGGVEWYILLDPMSYVQNPGNPRILMDACPRCFHTFISPSTFGHQFDRILPGGVLERSGANLPSEHRFRICALTQTAPQRYQPTFMRLLEAAHQRDFPRFVRWLASPMSLIPCPKDAVIYSPPPPQTPDVYASALVARGTAGRRWFSTPSAPNDSLVACEACFHTLLENSPLARYFSDITATIISHLVPVTSTPSNHSSSSSEDDDQQVVLLCGLYSHRMRATLNTVLANLANHHVDTPWRVVMRPLLDAAGSRFRRFLEIREQVEEFEEEEEMYMERLEELGVGTDDDIEGGGSVRGRVPSGVAKEVARLRRGVDDVREKRNRLEAEWRACD